MHGARAPNQQLWQEDSFKDVDLEYGAQADVTKTSCSLSQKQLIPRAPRSKPWQSERLRKLKGRRELVRGRGRIAIT